MAVKVGHWESKRPLDYKQPRCGYGGGCVESAGWKRNLMKKY